MNGPGPREGCNGKHNVILVHGAWHRPDCWNGVISCLDNSRFHVAVPDLNPVRHADDGIRPPETQTLLDLITTNNLDHIILVGHSYGGTIIAELAGLAPHRMEHLVFLNAFVPVRNKSIMDDLPRYHKKVLTDLAVGEGSIRLPYQAWRDTFMNGAGDKLAETTYQQLVPEPLARFTRKSQAEPVSLLDIPRTYIHSADDIALPPGKWGWVPRMPRRLGRHRLVHIDGNHEVIFTAPAIVAEEIQAAVHSCPGTNRRGRL